MTDAGHTTVGTASAWSPLAERSFWWHFLAMLAAMAVGMAVGMTVMMTVMMGMSPSPVLEGVEVQTLLMATWMSVGMSAWMLFRRHSWASILEMSAAMYLSFVILFPLYWAGLMSGGAVMVVGHVVMLPAMVLAMLHRAGEHRRPAVTAQ